LPVEGQDVAKQPQGDAHSRPIIDVRDAVHCTQDFRTSGVSQNLTLYTTPVIYLLIDRLWRRSEPAAPAE
jgi:hypothetical protein